MSPRSAWNSIGIWCGSQSRESADEAAAAGAPGLFANRARSVYGSGDAAIYQRGMSAGGAGLNFC